MDLGLSDIIVVESSVEEPGLIAPSSERCVLCSPGWDDVLALLPAPLSHCLANPPQLGHGGNKGGKWVAEVVRPCGFWPLALGLVVWGLE